MKGEAIQTDRLNEAQAPIFSAFIVALLFSMDGHNLSCNGQYGESLLWRRQQDPPRLGN